VGTNFYWMGLEAEQKEHIGKRSAAGWYCWNCGRTLFNKNEDIHTGLYHADRICPECGQEALGEGLDSGPVAIELGFAKPRRRQPVGVRGASSFSWAQDPGWALERAIANSCGIVDEYGHKLTGPEFVNMLVSNCPIWFTDLVGVEFS